MARDFLLCGFLFLQVLLGVSTPPPEGERDPSVGEYFMEAVDWMNRTRWIYFLPEDTDIDQDGNISDLEVQHKFNTYMGEVFKLIDHDKDQSIVEEELRSLKLDIPHLTKAVDIALENFPLKPFFLAADGNGDAFYDENDFYMPEEILSLEKINGVDTAISIGHRTSSDVTYHVIYADFDEHGFTGMKEYHFSVAKIGRNEGTVICKSLGYEGLERVIDTGELENSEISIQGSGDTGMEISVSTAFSCNGTESRIEACKQDEDDLKVAEKIRLGPVGPNLGMGVVCQDGTLRLVGGKDSSSGDIYVGKEGMVCIDWRHKRSTSEVVCRELGYSGVLRMTRDSAFTGDRADRRITKSFQCKGDEEKLDDCPFSYDGYCDSLVYGVVCATEGSAGMNQELIDLIRWDDRGPEVAPYKIWEEYGRFLFIADSDGDGKLTLEEIATKGKELMTKILEFLDENQDGKISLEDIDLHLSIGPVQSLASELFDDVTKGEGEFDLYDIRIAGQNMSKYFGNGLKDLDNNRDGKLNAADIFSPRHEEAKASFLVPLLSEKLDHNQDGKILREELRQFLDQMFNQLDMDKDGALTLEDVFILLQENGLNCLQVGAFRTFTKVLIGKIDGVTRNFFSYIFHQLDIDGNGQISTTEMEQMHIPCDTSGRYGKDPRYYGYPHGPDYDKKVEDDPTARYTCGGMFDTYFGSKIQDLIRSFPEFVFSERRGRWRDGRYEAHKETLMDKLTQHACQMLT